MARDSTTQHLGRSGMVGGLLHGLAVLDMFDADRDTVTVAEIADRLGVHRSNASRIAATLAAARYLVSTGQPGRYRLSAKLAMLGQLSRSQNDITTVTAPLLSQLVTAVGETGHLGVLEDSTTVTLNVVDGWHTVRMHSYIGKRSPAHCSSMGKALLAGLSEEDLDTLYAHVGLERRTAHTITDLGRLKEQLAQIRRRGYAVDNEELEEDLVCIAAPVFDRTSTVVASMSVSGPRSRITGAAIQTIADEVTAAGRRASDNMGAPSHIEGWPPAPAAGTTKRKATS